ncbi:MAG TPA: hypothetical protein VFP86_01490 [bacterium]|nr:hypothetical protein [bacterium]
MRNMLMALLVGVAILLPAAGAFADEGNYGDRDSSVEPVVVQAEPIQLGIVSGADKDPYHDEMRLDSREN